MSRLRLRRLDEDNEAKRESTVCGCAGGKVCSFSRFDSALTGPDRCGSGDSSVGLSGSFATVECRSSPKNPRRSRDLYSRYQNHRRSLNLLVRLLQYHCHATHSNLRTPLLL